MVDIDRFVHDSYFTWNSFCYLKMVTVVWFSHISSYFHYFYLCQEDTKNEPTLLGEQKDMQMDEVKPMTHMEADKLDTVMDLVFQYINNVCYENGEIWKTSTVFLTFDLTSLDM